MSKREELDRLWKQIEQCSHALEVESRANGGRVTRYWTNLRKEMQTLKRHYEKLKSGGEYDPNNITHGKIASKKKFIEAMTGKSGKDSHFRLED